MKKSKFTEGQIVFALKQSESGISVQEICRKMKLRFLKTNFQEKKKYKLKIKIFIKKLNSKIKIIRPLNKIKINQSKLVNKSIWKCLKNIMNI